MSTNRKNKLQPVFLMNFTKDIEKRYIIIEDPSRQNIFQSKINAINTKVNKIIQELNIRINSRHIPYISLTFEHASDKHIQSRIFIREEQTSSEFDELITQRADYLGVDVSHMLDVLIADGYKNVIISPLRLDAEAVVAYEFFECAIVDVLLDIAMFNSYSFLRTLSVSVRHEFSFSKYQYYKEHNLECFYDYKEKKPLYYSFAFSARVSSYELDINKYISLWSQFIEEKYTGKVHEEPSIARQLKMHVDAGEFPKNFPQRFSKREKGAYLVVRTNKDRTEGVQPDICNLFRIEEFKKGKVEIIPLSQFTRYKDLFENLDVSAFKIIKS